MMSHVSFMCVGLSILLSVVSSRMLVHYPMDMGNYVDYRQDLAGNILEHRIDLASNLYSDNIYPAALGIPHAGLGISHVVRDPLFGGAIINDPLMIGVPQRTVYIQAPANTVAARQIIQPGRNVQQVNSQPQVTWIQLDQQDPLNTVIPRSFTALRAVPRNVKISLQSASGLKQTVASERNVVPKRVAQTTETTTPTNINIKGTATKGTPFKTIVSKKRFLKNRVPQKQSVPQTTEAPKSAPIQRGIARRQRVQFNNRSKVNTLPSNFSNNQGRSLQRGSSTRNRAMRQSRLQLLRVPPLRQPKN